MLEKIDVSDYLLVQSCSSEREEKIALVSSMAATNSQTYITLPSSCSSLSKPSLYLSSSKSLSTSPLAGAVCSKQSLIGRLKAECLLSSLAVSLPRLDLDAYPSVHQGATKAPCPVSPYTCHRDSATCPPLKETGDAIPTSSINPKTPSNAEAVVQHLSASFQPPPVSPPAAHSKTRPPAAPKECTGAGTGTGRKVCVSGLNVSRWSKRGAGEFNERRRKKEGWTKAVSADYSSWGSMSSAGADTYAGVSCHCQAYIHASYDEDISDAEKVYQECQQSGPLSFSDCIPPARMKHCSKIGEGTFGEVFSTINDSNETVALKIIPVEGSQQVNGEQQKTFGEILHEIIISKELSCLNMKEINKTDGFIGLNNLHCVRGRYPEALLKAWDKFDRQKGSENDRPDFFDDEQLFLILEFEFGGSDLENINGKLSSLVQAKSVLHQVTAALAVAEQALCFEHRDLHWGNILVKNIKHKHNEFILNGTVHSIETRGVHVNIIDYSLSRLEIDGLTVSCDISNDEELFMGQGDYQFEIYRLMKKENNNCWSTYNPHSNVLWLHYLAEKLLSMNYKNKAQTNQQRTMKSALKSFQAEILRYPSATDALKNCRFFQ
uniref:Serine/threonine-protein kinase haspin n=1 Tax=Sinocyclocheilus grahami TaxID=75366 RepID=A0A672LSM2_SINGR